jgi:hypothetical protein
MGGFFLISKIAIKKERIAYFSVFPLIILTFVVIRK